MDGWMAGSMDEWVERYIFGGLDVSTAAVLVVLALLWYLVHQVGGGALDAAAV